MTATETNYATLSSILASSTYETLRDNFPEVEKVQPNDWLYFVSIFAFRFFMEIVKQSTLPVAEQEKIFSDTMAELVKEHPDFLLGFDDLNQFITPTTKPQDLGLWLAANLFKKNSRTLTEAELNLGIILGNIIATQAVRLKS